MTEELLFPELFERADAMKDRSTYDEFVSRFKNGSEWVDARRKFERLAKEEGSGTLSTLRDEYKKALETIHELADKDINGNYKIKPGSDGDEYKVAQNTLRDAKSDLIGFLTGDKVRDEQLDNKPLRQAFGLAKTKGEAAAKVMGGFWGSLKVEGLENTVKRNFGMLEEAPASSKIVFARVGVTGAGAALMGHAAFAGKTADGDDRSVLWRVLEGGVGALVAAGGALSGAAR